MFGDIPEGVQYTVTEALYYTQNNYVAHTDSFSGTVIEEGVTLPFINVYMPAPQGGDGSLTIRKEVIGDAPDPEKEFEFTVTAKNRILSAEKRSG